MVQNDIAYIVEADGGYTIRLRETVTNRHQLTTEEAICMLALFSSFMREKGCYNPNVENVNDDK